MAPFHLAMPKFEREARRTAKRGGARQFQRKKPRGRTETKFANLTQDFSPRKTAASAGADMASRFRRRGVTGK
jgi:hypothetical protein